MINSEIFCKSGPDLSKDVITTGKCRQYHYTSINQAQVITETRSGVAKVNIFYLIAL